MLMIVFEPDKDQYRLHPKISQNKMRLKNRKFIIENKMSESANKHYNMYTTEGILLGHDVARCDL